MQTPSEPVRQDIVLVGEDGCETLSDYPYGLEPRASLARAR